ncbi:MAG TPA: putative sporulation protein YtxC [Syntrophomonadaceae bacterium]|nr:putative sporulation protein YtxC [Syntrophomonadaceae bacterium]HNX29267.1 putative sporulation protein YtxC [Syntrophomonadaceae bacterium]HPR94091.1 putative sporulation protein YtxC [Syntrophomonadaceae bacterium]
MIYEFKITMAHGDNGFLSDFEDRLRWISEKGYHFSANVKSDRDLNMDYISLVLKGEKTDKIFRHEDIVHIFKHQMAEVLAEHIVRNWQAKLLWKEINKSCRVLNSTDKNIVFCKANNFLKKCNENESLNMLISFGRKNRMAHRLFEHINSNDNLVIEGFVNFCIKEYNREIRFAVELAREEMRNEKEYNDFVNLLRYFVDSQVPKLFEINLMMYDTGVFYLWDGEGVEIEENYLNYYFEDMFADEISLDDVLISILITIAPRRIVLHNTQQMPDSQSVEMIKKVFKEKISTCEGCERCVKALSEKDLHQ